MYRYGPPLDTILNHFILPKIATDFHTTTLNIIPRSSERPVPTKIPYEFGLDSRGSRCRAVANTTTDLRVI